LTKNSVIPIGAEPLGFARRRLREASWRGLFCCFGKKRRSLDYAAPLDFARGRLAASLGMTDQN
jgi:hypothetical protein